MLAYIKSFLKYLERLFFSVTIFVMYLRRLQENYQIINGLFLPKGISINDYIKKDEFSLKYETKELLPFRRWEKVVIFVKSF